MKPSVALAVTLFAASACSERTTKDEALSGTDDRGAQGEGLNWEKNPFEQEIMREAAFGVNQCGVPNPQRSWLEKAGFKLVRCDENGIFLERKPRPEENSLLPSSIAQGFAVINVMSTTPDAPTVRDINTDRSLELTGSVRDGLSRIFDFPNGDQSISVHGFVDKDLNVYGDLTIRQVPTLCNSHQLKGSLPKTICHRFDGVRLFTLKSQSLSYADHVAVLDTLQEYDWGN